MYVFRLLQPSSPYSCVMKASTNQNNMAGKHSSSFGFCMAMLSMWHERDELDFAIPGGSDLFCSQICSMYFQRAGQAFSAGQVHR